MIEITYKLETLFCNLKPRDISTLNDIAKVSTFKWEYFLDFFHQPSMNFGNRGATSEGFTLGQGAALTFSDCLLSLHTLHI